MSHPPTHCDKDLIPFLNSILSQTIWKTRNKTKTQEIPDISNYLIKSLKTSLKLRSRIYSQTLKKNFEKLYCTAWVKTCESLQWAVSTARRDAHICPMITILFCLFHHLYYCSYLLKAYKFVFSIFTLPLIFVCLFWWLRICFSPFIYCCNHLRLEIAVHAPGSENVRNFVNYWRLGRATHAPSPKSFREAASRYLFPTTQFRTQ